MPYYHFKCPACAHQFEDRFSMAEADGKNVECPSCGHRGLERVYKGAVAIKGGEGGSSCSTCPTCTPDSCNL